MSHSAARLSFQVEIYFKSNSARKLRPVAFRHPISRILAFSWLYKWTYWPAFACKNHANSDGCTYYARNVKDIKWLWQLKEKDCHFNSKKKLCNCEVNYTKIYYIIYIVLCVKSNGYISHCGGNGRGISTAKRDVFDSRYLDNHLNINFITNIIKRRKNKSLVLFK